MTHWNGRNAIISSYWVCLFTKFRWRLHRALRLAWITWIPFILWFSMIFKIGLNIVHGFMNATFIDDSLCQWSLTINVHSCIYEHTSCMINDHRNNYEHWSSMIIDIDYHSWRSMIVAMICCWSYMISVDHCIISWPLFCGLLLTVHALCNRSNGARLRCVIETTIQTPLPEMDDIKTMEGIILEMTSMWVIINWSYTSDSSFMKRISFTSRIRLWSTLQMAWHCNGFGI